MRNMPADCVGVLQLILDDYELEVIIGAVDFLAHQANEVETRVRSRELVNKLQRLIINRDVAAKRASMKAKGWKSNAEIRDAEF